MFSVLGINRFFLQGWIDLFLRNNQEKGKLYTVFSQKWHLEERDATWGQACPSHLQGLGWGDKWRPTHHRSIASKVIPKTGELPNKWIFLPWYVYFYNNLKGQVQIENSWTSAQGHAVQGVLASPLLPPTLPPPSLPAMALLWTMRGLCAHVWTPQAVCLSCMHTPLLATLGFALPRKEDNAGPGSKLRAIWAEYSGTVV